jgi:hypothetical protein
VENAGDPLWESDNWVGYVDPGSTLILMNPSRKGRIEPRVKKRCPKQRPTGVPDRVRERIKHALKGNATIARLILHQMLSGIRLATDSPWQP